jgi:hypothetical protein
MSPDEWLLMADIEKLIGRTFPRDVVPGMEPSHLPLPPREAEAPRPERSIRARTGMRRRR